MENLDDQLTLVKAGGLNSGNIRHDSNSFREYATDEEGAQDHTRLLGVYANKKKLNTIGGIIDVYAPTSDNNTHNNNYKKYIADKMGVGVNDTLDLNDPTTRGKFAYYQAQFEHGAKSIHHTENWYIQQADEQMHGSGKSSKQSSNLPNMDDQLEEVNLPNLDDSLIEQDVPQEVANAQSNEDIPSNPTPALPVQPEKTAGGYALGAGENALSLLTGSIGSTVGAISGGLQMGYHALKGDATDEAVQNQVEQSAANLTSQLTYSPKTPEGQQIYREVTAPITDILTALGPEAGVGTALERPLTRVGEVATTPLTKVLEPGSEVRRTNIEAAQQRASTLKQAAEEGTVSGNPEEWAHMTDSERKQAVKDFRDTQKELIPKVEVANFFEKIKDDPSWKVIAPDMSKYSAEDIGMSKGAHTISAVGSKFEKLIPGAHFVRDIFEKSSPGKGKAVRSLQDILLVLGMEHIPAFAKSLYFTVPTALLKQAIDRGHLNDIRRVVGGEPLYGDVARRKAIGLTQASAGQLTRVQQNQQED